MVSSEAHAGLIALEVALERYDLGVDPELPVRDWPGISAELENLAKLMHWSADYAGQGELTPALLGELRWARQQPHPQPRLLCGLAHCGLSLRLIWLNVPAHDHAPPQPRMLDQAQPPTLRELAKHES